MPFDEALVWTIIGNEMIIGYPVVWYHNIDECRVLFDDIVPMHYHEHKKRENHHTTPKIRVGGTHRIFRRLHFGTQVQVYRHAIT